MVERPITAGASASWFRKGIPRGVWVLGFVSLLMDMSSEMIHALLPVYLVAALGTSALTVGALEGIAEATAAVTKVFSGGLSDWLGRRKLLLVLGYGLGALTKPVFPLAPSVGWLVAARFIDRVGKGIRGAPRDAMVADIAPPHLRGASFGLRQSLDTVGGLTGPLLAIGLMWLTSNSFTAVFWVAVVPAFLSVGLVVAAVQEPTRPQPEYRIAGQLRRSKLGGFGTDYWCVVAVGAVFNLARFSEAFLVLRSQSIGMPPMLAPAVLVAMNLAYVVSSYPVGVLSDRTGRVSILMLGLVLLIVADVMLAMASGVAGVMAGALVWGLHMGFTQGLFAALVADTAPPELRATAYGMFNLIAGVALLLASLGAGVLWDLAGPQATFLAGAAFTAVALTGASILRARLEMPRRG